MEFLELQYNFTYSDNKWLIVNGNINMKVVILDGYLPGKGLKNDFKTPKCQFFCRSIFYFLTFSIEAQVSDNSTKYDPDNLANLQLVVPEGKFYNGLLDTDIANVTWARSEKIEIIGGGVIGRAACVLNFKHGLK